MTNRVVGKPFLFTTIAETVGSKLIESCHRNVGDVGQAKRGKKNVAKSSGGG
jgi:hypothetical protein